MVNRTGAGREGFAEFLTSLLTGSCNPAGQRSSIVRETIGGSSARAGFSRCSYSTRHGIQALPCGEYPKASAFALQKDIPLSSRPGSAPLAHSRSRAGEDYVVQPNIRLRPGRGHLGRQTTPPKQRDRPRPVDTPSTSAPDLPNMSSTAAKESSHFSRRTRLVGMGLLDRRLPQ
jgi:hypothetical protein